MSFSRMYYQSDHDRFPHPVDEKTGYPQVINQWYLVQSRLVKVAEEDVPLLPEVPQHDVKGLYSSGWNPPPYRQVEFGDRKTNAEW